MAGEGDLTAAFRAKAQFMGKQWEPQSAPSNRDRLELYALHKQAVSGDAPASLSTTAGPAERSKFQAWRSKSGVAQDEAMRLYLQEADRQVRVYGTKNQAVLTSASASSNGTTPQTPHPTPNNGGANTAHGGETTITPRGLAAIPLLCAAAAESRPAYLRRLAQTPLEAAWWKRQEALCAPPGTLGALPETLLLAVAKFLEHVSLTSPTSRNLVASFLWPLHNSLLSLWMLVILYLTTLRCAWNTVLILVWGSRRTGISLAREWDDNLPLVGQSVEAMYERHQALTVRLVGVTLLALPTVLNFLKKRIPNMAVASVLFVVFILMTWWYWLLLEPFLMTCLMGTAVASGVCFALIEFAGV